MKDLESRSLSYTIVGEFLLDLKEKFGEGDDITIKVAEQKKMKKRSKIIEEFVQEFKKVTKRCRYKERPLVEEFK